MGGFIKHSKAAVFATGEVFDMARVNVKHLGLAQLKDPLLFIATCEGQAKRFKRWLVPLHHQAIQLLLSTILVLCPNNIGLVPSLDINTA